MGLAVVLVAVWALGFAPRAADAADAAPLGPPVPEAPISITQERTPPATGADEPADADADFGARESLPLGLGPSPDPKQPARSTGSYSVGRTIFALAAVIGAILLVRWIVKALAARTGGIASQLGPGGRAPSGVLSVLARYPVARGQSLVLLQMDQRVLLLGQSADGFRALAQISDPEEVASLIIKTRDEESASLAARFTSMLHGFERDPDLAERAGLPARTPTTVASALRLFPRVKPARPRAVTSADALAAVRARLASMDGEQG